MTPKPEGLSETSGKMDDLVVRQSVVQMRKLISDGLYKKAREEQLRMSTEIIRRLAEANTAEDFAAARGLGRALLEGTKTLVYPD